MDTTYRTYAGKIETPDSVIRLAKSISERIDQENGRETRLRTTR
jgi:hypothetical protein